jgi:hypothetical protein
VEGGGYKERVKKTECSENIIYTCMKMEKVETIPGMEGGGIKEMMEGMNSAMIYCKNFCKFYIVPSVQQ